MAGMIATKPYAGFAAALVFGFLGMLLIGMESAPGGSSDIALWMFRIVGSFLLFVALGSLLTAISILRKNREMKREKGGG